MATQANSAVTNGAPKAPQTESRLYSTAHPPDLSVLADICSRQTGVHKYPSASAVERNIPIYDCKSLSGDDASVQDEWYDALLKGPGVIVLKNMYQDLARIERVNAAFERIIEREKAGQKTDHFGVGGKNDRIWNSFSKLCLEDPQAFIQYYDNPWLALVCEAWLGPGYRITAQANIVKPGGAAQVSHRDYHLGFQDERSCARFPKAMQIASQLLTLQGAVAHTDMPLESGPTRFLPFSQLFEEGFMAFRRPEFVQYFQENYVSLPLKKGDGVFFSPALMHAAGENLTSDFSRSANLLQVSSAFGKPMESVVTIPLVERCWSYLHAKFVMMGWSKDVAALVAALGEGYPFPTNLDRRPPQPGGMAPASEQDVIRMCLEEGVSDASAVAKILLDIRQASQA